MGALLFCMGLLASDLPRPDTTEALHGVVLEVSQLCESRDFDTARIRLDEHEADLQAFKPQSWYGGIEEGQAATPEQLALLPYTRGVLELQAAEFEPAASALREARAQAGPGELRWDSTYNLGVLHLVQGERFRAQIPELSGAAPGPSPLPEDAEEAPDPLESAREHYLKARDWFVERLILDWRDPDTRANTELVQRRLRELDELEMQRQEQQGEEQQEPRDGQEPQEGDEEGDQSSDDEQEPGEESPESAEGEREPDEPEGEDSEEEPEDEEGEEADAEEVHLTQEEMQRLLELLREIEEEGEEVQDALRRIGRQNVDRDW